MVLGMLRDDTTVLFSRARFRGAYTSPSRPVLYVPGHLTGNVDRQRSAAPRLSIAHGPRGSAVVLSPMARETGFRVDRCVEKWEGLLGTRMDIRVWGIRMLGWTWSFYGVLSSRVCLRVTVPLLVLFNEWYDDSF